MARIIGIDHGFGRIKTAHTDFTASAIAYEDGCPAVNGPAMLTMHDQSPARRYELGGQRTTLHLDKTCDQLYWAMTLGAIAAEIDALQESRMQSVIIAAGLPYAQFRRQKDDFTKYLNRSGPHIFSIGQNNYSIAVEGVYLYPQGYSALTEHLSAIRRSALVHIIDIGSWTTDTLTLEHGIPVQGSERSMEWGAIRCIDYIRRRIETTEDMSFTDAQIEGALLAESDLSKPLRVKMQSMCSEWIQERCSFLRERGYDLATAPVYFLGGGAALMERYLPDAEKTKMLAPHYITDIHANAAGYERICRAETAARSAAS